MAKKRHKFSPVKKKSELMCVRIIGYRLNVFI